MTIEECYRKIGSDYRKVVERLGSPSLVERFALKFLADTSYQKLKEAMENGEGEIAFVAGHTLKGVCLNLGFDALSGASSALVESMREHREVARGESHMKEITAEYEKLIGLLKQVSKEDF